MLGGDAHAGGLLHPQGHGGGGEARHQGILGIILEVPAAEGIPVDIHARSQPEGDAELFHLPPHQAAHILHQPQVPALGQQGGDGNGGGILIVIHRAGGILLRLVLPHEGGEAVLQLQDLAALQHPEMGGEAQTGRSVRQDHGGDPRNMAARLPGGAGDMDGSGAYHALVPAGAHHQAGQGFVRLLRSGGGLRFCLGGDHASAGRGRVHRVVGIGLLRGIRRGRGRRGGRVQPVGVFFHVGGVVAPGAVYAHVLRLAGFNKTAVALRLRLGRGFGNKERVSPGGSGVHRIRRFDLLFGDDILRCVVRARGNGIFLFVAHLNFLSRLLPAAPRF